MFKNIS